MVFSRAMCYLMKPCLHWRRRVIKLSAFQFEPLNKNMKLNCQPARASLLGFLFALVALLVTSCSTCGKHCGSALNTITAKEQAEGLPLLWDGHTTAGWRSPKNDEFPTNSWLIKDGVLSVVSSG